MVDNEIKKLAESYRFIDGVEMWNENNAENKDVLIIKVIRHDRYSAEKELAKSDCMLKIEHMNRTGKELLDITEKFFDSVGYRYGIIPKNAPLYVIGYNNGEQVKVTKEEFDSVTDFDNLRTQERIKLVIDSLKKKYPQNRLELIPKDDVGYILKFNLGKYEERILTMKLKYAADTHRLNQCINVLLSNAECDVKIKECSCVKLDYLVEIDIPEGITHIENEAFRYCSGLKKVTLPESLTQIGDKAFASCDKLEEVTISNGALQLGEGIFEGTPLQRAVLPQGLKEIPNSMFNCSGRHGVLKTELPDTIERIGKDAFANCTFETFTIPDGVKQIDDYAFRGCTADVIVVPGSVKEFGKKVFSPKGFGLGIIEEIVCRDGITSIGAKMFEGAMIRKISIPETVTEICEYAFLDSSLSRIVIPGNVKVIKKKAFWNSALNEVIIEDGVESIGLGAFGCCRFLRKVVIPESVTHIERGAFVSCHELKTASYPDRFRANEKMIFSGCVNFEYAEYAEKKALKENKVVATYTYHNKRIEEENFIFDDKGGKFFMFASAVRELCYAEGDYSIHVWSEAEGGDEQTSLKVKVVCNEDKFWKSANGKTVYIKMNYNEVSDSAMPHLIRNIMHIMGPKYTRDEDTDVLYVLYPNSTHICYMTKSEFDLPGDPWNFKPFPEARTLHAIGRLIEDYPQNDIRRLSYEYETELKYSVMFDIREDGRTTSVITKWVRYTSDTVQFENIDSAIEYLLTNAEVVMVLHGEISITGTAFQNLKIEHMILPVTLKSIGEETFKNCQIKRLTISGKTCEIAENAFSGSVVGEVVAIDDSVDLQCFINAISKQGKIKEWD